MRNTEDCIALPEIAEELANEGTEIEAEDYNTYEEEKTVDENIRSTHDQASYSDNWQVGDHSSRVSILDAVSSRVAFMQIGFNG